MKPLSILMLHSKAFPFSHALLETIYARILPERGHNITWVMQAREDRRIVGWELVKWNQTYAYLIEGDSTKKPWQKLTGRLVNNYRAISHVIAHSKIDVVQVRNDWIPGLAGALIQRRHGIPFVYQISFPTAMMFQERGGWRRAYGAFTACVQRLLIKEASLILPISDWMKEEFEKKGVPESKMLSFPLGADTSVRPEQVDGESIRSGLGLANCPTLIYFGEMGRVRRLDFLIRVLEMVRREIPTVKLLMLGKSSAGEQDWEWLKSLADRSGLTEQVIFVGFVPRENVVNYIAASDVGVSPIVPSPMFRISSPTKLMETLAMSKPIVANDIPEQKQILAASGAGICTPYEEQEFANAIVWLLKHPEEARAMGRRGRQYIEEHRSYEILANRIEKAYYRLLDEHPTNHLA